MRRLTLWIVSTVCAVVLLFSYRTSLHGAGAASPPAAAPGIVGQDTSSPPTSPPTGTRSSSVAPKTLTVNGTVAQTSRGPVQVQVKIRNKRITDVRVLRHPDNSDHDTEINGYALPRLRAEVLRAQSANVDAISGATVTSDGYRESLQAALDAAHFG
ncbi:FMN-binding protein [Mangrovihabitans endophyticus]|uniref:FMN-binding protein n=1 Tax=Mangrovihabitans endophyticus TaxID=1751298 RepID=A0A8J3BXL4_9ACTN|nr:FMN-binding protein [Mangrovihabitans endophyticus]GGK81474.1 FMN-binding protein [Mangrovihabitans endophyticus]